MRSRRNPWTLVSLLLTVVAVAAVTTGGVLRDTDRGARVAAGPAIAAGPGVPVPAPPGPPHPVTAPRGVRPTVLTIPGIDVVTPLVRLGLEADGGVEVPTNPDRAGWYRLGPAPGEPGSAVVLGHVDSRVGPAVFARLRTVGRGDRVEVGRADGSVAHFVVRSVATYANDDFPAASVYRNRGAPVLTLVTCGGGYDRSRGGYQANVVVTATYVGLS